MATIPTLQIPQLGAVSGGIDFSPLASLGELYKKKQQEMSLSELGKGLASGTVDYRTAAASRSRLATSIRG